ncbi:MAG: trehalose-phosphatase [Acidobacteriaceae bacterium]
MTRLLLEHFEEVEQAIARSRRILLLLDFDGTLAPIVARPELAALPEGMRSLLQQINEDERVEVAVISGRALVDLKPRVGLDLIYAGNHGLEIEGHGLAFHGLDLSRATPALEKVIATLQDSLQSVEGALIENKGATLSIHYRAVAEARVPEVVSAVESACAEDADLLEVHHGKKVLEVRPKVQWNKGEASRWILQQLGSKGTLVISMGDDRTDEDIFKALPESISIKVGEGETFAQYRVSGPEDVLVVLRRIHALTRLA